MGEWMDIFNSNATEWILMNFRIEINQWTGITRKLFNHGITWDDLRIARERCRCQKFLRHSFSFGNLIPTFKIHIDTLSLFFSLH